MKKILIFVVIFVMIMTSACSKPEDNEIATSIDENVQADQSNDTDDTKTEQTNDETISDLSEKDPENITIRKKQKKIKLIPKLQTTNKKTQLKTNLLI